MPRSKAFDEEEALRRALDVFWRKGYCATSMQDLVDAMGINRASLYDTYGDKHRLYLAALESYRRESSRQMIHMLKEAVSIRQVIRSMLEFIVQESLDDSSRRGCFMVNSTVELASHDDAIAQVVGDNRETLEAAMTAAIRRGQEQGEISGGRAPQSLARFLFSTISGLRVYAKTGASEAECLQVVEVAMDSLLA